jgi:hypothetical protein
MCGPDTYLRSARTTSTIITMTTTVPMPIYIRGAFHFGGKASQLPAAVPPKPGMPGRGRLCDGSTRLCTAPAGRIWPIQLTRVAMVRAHARDSVRVVSTSRS